MNYALVIKALERHVDIAQRSLNFFREQRIGTKFAEAGALLEEGVRALDEVRKMKEMHDYQTDLWKAGVITDAPNPVPPDTSDEDLPPSSADFADKGLSSGKG